MAQGAAPDNAIGAGGSFGHLNELLNSATLPMSVQLAAAAFDLDQASAACILQTA